MISVSKLFHIFITHLCVFDKELVILQENCK